jgi:hypothetical protein
MCDFFVFPEIVTFNVTCQNCGKEEAVVFPETIPVLDVESHLCKECEAKESIDDRLNPDAYNDRVQLNYGVRLNEVELRNAWDDYKRCNLNGRGISSYDHIMSLNVNDRKF